MVRTENERGSCWRAMAGPLPNCWPPMTAWPAGSPPGRSGWSLRTVSQTERTCCGQRTDSSSSTGESVLQAPPERDLWNLAEADASVLADYSALTGTVIDNDALRLYRLWYDLAEISGYIAWFSGSHGDTADTAEAWQNLQYYLRPAERWPDLLAG